MEKRDLEALAESYGEMLERWKIRVAATRAARYGLSLQDTEDLLQDIVPELASLEYDAEKANGKAEASVLIILVDNRIKDLLRRESRRREVMDDLKRQLGVGDDPEDEVPPTFRQVVDYSRLAAIREVLASLDGEDARVAECLLRGLNTTDIATEMGWGWHRVQRVIRNIRQRFEGMGFREWEVE